MNDWQRLNLLLQMESLITERDGMRAANQVRLTEHASPQYSEESFRRVQLCFEQLINDLRGIAQ